MSFSSSSQLWRPFRWLVGLPGMLIAAGVAVVILGCQREERPSPAPAPQSGVAPNPVRLLVVADPALATVADRQWSARSDAPLEIIQWTEDEFLSFLTNTKSESKQVTPADAVIYPTSMMGELAESGCIAPLPEYVSRGNFAVDDYAEQDIFPLIREAVVRWGEQHFAVSCGQPVLVLGYRTDILDAVQATPPETWDELSALVERIANFDFSDTPALKTDFVLAQPLNDRWAAELLLARSASSAKDRARFSTLFDLRSMKAQIATMPFDDALTAMLRDQVHGSSLATQWDPCAAMRALKSGQCAVAIGWLCANPEKAPNIQAAGSLTSSDKTQAPIKIVQLPGSRRTYSLASSEWRDVDGNRIQQVTYLPAAGRCGSVFRQSRRQRAAWGLLVRLTGQEWGFSVSSISESSAIFRESQRSQVSRWVGSDWPSEVARSYADAVKESLSQSMWISSPRLSSGAEYRAALSSAVQNALDKSQTVSEALETASQSWAEITSETGKSVQSNSYHRSLGLVP